MKKKINCEEIVSAINFKKDEKKNLLLFLINEDNTLYKKELGKVKNFINSNYQKSKNCKKHWFEKKEKIEEKEEIKLNIEEKEKEIEKFILSSKVPNKEKRNIFKKAEIRVNNELEKKIKNSLVDEENNLEIIRNVVKIYEEKANEIIFLRNKKKKIEEKIEKIESKIRDKCEYCQKYCKEHSRKFEEHKKDTCCDKENEKINRLKGEINEIIKNKKKEKDNSTSKKLENKLKRKKKELKMIQRSVLSNYRNCLRLKELIKEQRKCLKCLKIKKEKEIKNSLRHVLLVNKNLISPQIYLLSKELVCLYNKKNNLENIGKRKLLRNKEREITDIKFYN